MKIWLRILLTAAGLVLIATELVGDVPGAALGVALISWAWVGK